MNNVEVFLNTIVEYPSLITHELKRARVLSLTLSAISRVSTSIFYPYRLYFLEKDEPSTEVQRIIPPVTPKKKLSVVVSTDSIFFKKNESFTEVQRVLQPVTPRIKLYVLSLQTIFSLRKKEPFTKVQRVLLPVTSKIK